jgi:hypothetical protein
MAIRNWGNTTYPTSLDTSTLSPLPLVDSFDEIMASHPSSLATSVLAIETKLGITGGVATGFGGFSFEPSGKVVNPGSAGDPTLWVDNSSPNFQLTYTDELGVDHPLAYSGGSSFWQRVGTVLSPVTSGDTISVNASGQDIDLVTNRNLQVDALNTYIDADEFISLNFDKSDSGFVNTFNISSGTSSPHNFVSITNGGDITITPKDFRNLTVTTGGTGVVNGDIELQADGGNLFISDEHRSGSGYSSDMPFGSATSDWTTFVSNFGDGTSLLSALNSAYSSGGGGSTNVSSGDNSMYSSSRGDFVCTYASGTTATITGLPFNINSSNIVAVIRKPTGTGISVQRLRGDDLDCSWTPDASDIGKGLLTLASSFFSATDTIDLLIEGPEKAYDPLNNANRSIVINPDSVKSETDPEIVYTSLTGPGTKDKHYLMAESGYHRLSIDVTTLTDVTIKVYGSNSYYFDTSGLVTWQDITLLATGTQQITTTGGFNCLDTIPYKAIRIEMDYASATGGSGSVQLSVTRTAV